ncbi:MAG: hypothetical protein IIA45_15635, partial [Bacteroidetes bacterium]|nr:hypothetical protein [Bacteroidota bacterium]
MVLYRSIKVFVFLVVTLSQSIISTQAQVVQTLLFVEDFDTVNNISFSTAMGTPKYGNNEWFINNEYNGNGQYPNTISQSITLGNIGKIGYANGRYLHVRDMNATLASNACFNPLNNSERWAVMNNGVCTFGFDVIGLNFWWTCEGSSKSYGEVYYSIDGGTTWILTKNTDNLTKYKNMPVWKYTVVEDSAFLDQLDLRFAFKWTNVGASSGEKGPFSVDDIMIVATTNPLPPTNITAVFATPNPICQEQVGGIRFFFNVSDDLCPYNVFIVEFADSAGSFANATPISAYGTTNVFGLTTTVPMTAGLWVSPPMGPIHTNIPIGGCYKWRVRMITPPFAGAIVSTGCIQVIDCIDSIVTMEAAVLKDPQNPG